MAVPVETDVRLADDASNTGKRVRTQSRVVGANTVHSHYFVPQSRRSKLGIYHYSTPLQTVAGTTPQDGTTTGFFWLQNPSGSGLDLVIRKVVARFTGTVAANTSARLILVKFTFTGTPSGAVITPARRKTSVDAVNVGTMRTAVTGMTVTLGATICSFIIPALISAANVFPTFDQEWPHSGDFEDDDVMLEPAEGAVLYQPDVGIASDSRRFVIDLSAEEAER